MNWVLILIMGYNTGATSEQIGPFASYGDCQKSYVIAQGQDDKNSPRIRHHFCIPKPRTIATSDRPFEFPPEFD